MVLAPDKEPEWALHVTRSTVYGAHKTNQTLGLQSGALAYALTIDAPPSAGGGTKTAVVAAPSAEHAGNLT